MKELEMHAKVNLTKHGLPGWWMEAHDGGMQHGRTVGPNTTDGVWMKPVDV
jgi:hypothetical protein